MLTRKVGYINTKNNDAIYKISGDHSVRTPGEYRKPDPTTGTDTKIPLVNTCERVHASVRVRLAQPGNLGINDNGKYIAEALTKGADRHGWKLEKVSPGTQIAFEPVLENGQPIYVWRSRDAKASSKGFPSYMIEEMLGVWETRLVQHYADVNQNFANYWPDKSNSALL